MRYTPSLISDSVACRGRAKESLLWVSLYKMIAVHIASMSCGRLRVRLDVHPANLAQHASSANDLDGHVLRLLAPKFKEKRMPFTSAMENIHIN